MTLPLSALAALATASAPSPAVSHVDPITWTATSTGTSGPHLDITYGRRSSTGVALGSAADLQPLRQALAGGGGPVTFVLDREPGRLACSGTTTPAGRGSGTCRFAARPAFAQGLAARGLRVDKGLGDLLPLTVLDARIAALDALRREGARPSELGQFIAATALKLTGDYVRELKSAGLVLGTFPDLIACRALKVDGAYVRELASAGYTSLSSHDVISMKAVGVTGRYARAVNASAGRP